METQDKQTCDRCEGGKFVEIKGISQVCPKCHGFGEVDWVEQICGKQSRNIWNNKSSKSTLERVNVTRMIDYVNKALQDVSEYYVFELPDEVSCKALQAHYDSMLEQLKSRKIIYDFNTSVTPVGDQINADIYIKPTKTVDYIEIECVINKRK